MVDSGGASARGGSPSLKGELSPDRTGRGGRVDRRLREGRPARAQHECHAWRLAGEGIPAEVVTIPPNKILRPDLQVDTIDVATRWRTYWYVSEDSDLQ